MSVMSRDLAIKLTQNVRDIMFTLFRGFKLETTFLFMYTIPEVNPNAFLVLDAG